MAHEIEPASAGGERQSPFERIRRVSAAGHEHWSSRDFAQVLGYADYRNFEQVLDKAKSACFNSGVRIEDHFVDSTDMVEIGKGGPRRKKRSRGYRVRRRGQPTSRLEAEFRPPA